MIKAAIKAMDNIIVKVLNNDFDVVLKTYIGILKFSCKFWMNWHIMI